MEYKNIEKLDSTPLLTEGLLWTTHFFILFCFLYLGGYSFNLEEVLLLLVSAVPFLLNYEELRVVCCLFCLGGYSIVLDLILLVLLVSTVPFLTEQKEFKIL